MIIAPSMTPQSPHDHRPHHRHQRSIAEPPRAQEHEQRPHQHNRSQSTNTVPTNGCANATLACHYAERCVSACAAYGRVCPCTARIAAQEAYDAVLEMRLESALFGPDIFASGFTYLNPEDVVVDGKRLGEGGFSYVNSCVITTGPDAGKEFAIKFLKRKIMVDLHQFKHGAADLAIEAHFLQALHHEHIIQLHGIAAGDMRQNIAAGKERAFFIVVDRLVDTLEERIHKWSEEREQHSGLLARWSPDYKENRKKEMFDRIRLASQIASAMEYLHSLNIVFRDLKPDNIGFDKDGVLKLFDFGLAKELKMKNHRFDGKYELTGNTGSRRYMAPEVAKDEHYDRSVDVYSFGILLWELCSAEKPFFGYTSDKHMRQVAIGGERPKMDSIHTMCWPVNLQWLMTRCWSEDPTQRPTFTIVKQVLQDILNCKCDIPTIPQEKANCTEGVSNHSTEQQSNKGSDESAHSAERHLPIPSFFRHKRTQSACPESPCPTSAIGSNNDKDNGSSFASPMSPVSPTSPMATTGLLESFPKPLPLGSNRRNKTWGFGRKK